MIARYVRKTAAFAVAATAFLASPSHAQDWPAKPVRIIVPFGAGSTPDVIMRLIAEHLQRKLGQPFVVENKPGASGMTGTDAVAKAAPNGSTIGISIGGPPAINTLLFAKLPYDPRKDIARKLAVQAELFLVGILEGGLVASIMAGYEGHRGWVNYLAVAPGHRRKGLARRLMEEVERRLLERGCPKINVQVRSANAEAMAFYRRLGYVADEAVALGKRLIPD